MSNGEDDFLCVGVCMFDPDSGYCLGCGRPPEPVSGQAQGIVAEEARPLRIADEGLDGDSPGKS
ncbi:MAG: DUF1289 domain-containing protein [Candidatus Accumulibacter sp.]|uniref:DUF1289 domain-containing protein n=1 Tax=Accumulibacter sp. TaxID=2053492 RepID=UPI0025CBB586|nr:DUF1289 domain-containing protein [Accumulibacter sp.]MCP5248841.1 DUF1289 domain-containing protein [Accumulibacter sp.]